eukprot:7083167-Prymnesium_polylepis.4
MATVQELSFAAGNATFYCPIITLLDRRGRPKKRPFLLVRSLELILWGPNDSTRHTLSPLCAFFHLLLSPHTGSTGAFMSLLRRLSMGDSVLVAEKHSITTELLTEEENAACLDAYRPLAPVEGRARVKRASLIPLSIAVAAVQAHGRTPSTSALLKGLGETPLLWSKWEEQEANRKEYECDLVLDDEIREMEGECDVHMAVELESMVSFQKVAVDEEKAESWTL